MSIVRKYAETLPEATQLEIITNWKEFDKKNGL